MAPQVLATPRSPAHRGLELMDTELGYTHHDHDDDTVEAHYACLERPCCLPRRLGVRRLRRRARRGERSLLLLPPLCG